MIKKEIDQLNLSDHFMFANVMSDKVICRMFLEKLLGIEIEEIEISQYEKAIEARLESKDIRLDIYARGRDGKIYDIEMQNSNKKEEYNLAKRVRYYQRMIDTEELKEGQHYNKLPESYIIFVCAFDEFGLGKSKYTFQYRCNEAPELLLQNEAKLIILNTKGKGEETDLDPEIKAFLRYIENSNAAAVNESGSDFLDRVHRRFEFIKKEKRDVYMTLQEWMEMEIRDEVEAEVAERLESAVEERLENAVAERLESAVAERLESAVAEKLEGAVSESSKKATDEANLQAAIKMEAEGLDYALIQRVTGFTKKQIAERRNN